MNVVDEMELVVEGQIDKEMEGSTSSNHFLRRFILPGDVEVDCISSVMSSDGVLTVIAPKKVRVKKDLHCVYVQDLRLNTISCT